MDEAENCNRIAFIYRGKLVAEGTPQDMKLKQMREQVVEIDCDRVDIALTTLRESKLFDEVALYGSMIHAIGHEVEEKIVQVRDVLTSQGIIVKSVEVILPSLEDVFIARLRHVDTNNS
jgi:ABC-2 type transport system ATP-binding protein